MRGIYVSDAQVRVWADDIRKAEKRKNPVPELDICVSGNSNLVHIEEKVSGKNVATITFKGATKEEKINIATMLIKTFNSEYVNE